MGNTYYSPSIPKIYNENTIKNLNFDAGGCQLLQLISKKTKNKNMPHYLDLSLSAIEKRKATIKNKLLKDKGTDIEIIEEAEKLELI